MTDHRETLRRYLQGRMALGEPPIILPNLPRRDALQALARESRASGVAGKSHPRSAPTAAGRQRSGHGRSGPSATGIPPDPVGPPAEPGREDSVPATPELARLAREGTAEQVRELGFEDLRQVALACQRCALREGRKNVVFGEGASNARVVCVGEAPGAVEDDTGRPFVGRAGQLLDLMLISVGLRRDEVYICNVLKCRPPRNRNPHPEEVAACSPFLLRQIDLIDPEVIVAFGSFAAQTLLGTRDSIGRLRGRTHLYGRFPLVVTYHPAASLRNPGWKRPTWEDLQIVRRLLDGDSRLRSTGSGGELSLGLS